MSNRQIVKPEIISDEAAALAIENAAIEAAANAKAETEKAAIEKAATDEAAKLLQPGQVCKAGIVEIETETAVEAEVALLLLSANAKRLRKSVETGKKADFEAVRAAKAKKMLKVEEGIDTAKVLHFVDRYAKIFNTMSATDEPAGKGTQYPEQALAMLNAMEKVGERKELCASARREIVAKSLASKATPPTPKVDNTIDESAPKV